MKKKKLHSIQHNAILVGFTVLIIGMSYVIHGYTTSDNRDNDTQFTIQQASDFSCDGVTVISQSECEALLAVYNATDGANRFDNERWLINKNPCSWRGVICDDDSVVVLNLSKNNLTGPLPGEIAQLENLFALYLGENNLTGSIPESLLSMKHLQHVELSKNNLEGSIPGTLGYVAEYSDEIVLFLDNNKLCDTIPEGVTENSKIKMLRIKDNNLVLSEEVYSSETRAYLKNLLARADFNNQSPVFCNE